MTTLMTIVGVTLGLIYLAWAIVTEHKKSRTLADENRLEPNSETIEAIESARRGELTTVGTPEGLFVDLDSAEEDSYWVARARVAEESGWAGEEESMSLLKELQCPKATQTEQEREELAKNPELRKEKEEEQRLWDNTLMDGLEDE